MAIWNEEGVSLTIVITPPWWNTTWFRAFASSLLVDVAVGGLPMAFAASASSVRDDTGGARR